MNKQKEKIKIEDFRQILKELGDLYERKNNNYGDSFDNLIDLLGPIAGLVPLHNKLSRATNLVLGGHNDFENLEDTLKDLANYSIMFLRKLQEDSHIKHVNINNKNESNGKLKIQSLHEDQQYLVKTSKLNSMADYLMED